MLLIKGVIFVGFTLQAKLVSSKHLIQVYLKILSHTLENLASHRVTKYTLEAQAVDHRSRQIKKCDCSPDFATEKRFMLFTLYFVFNFNSENLTLQEMHRYFIVYEYLATQATSSELKSMVQAVCENKVLSMKFK